eukprot:CAMPEP_0184418498 /NCGR_PEP_ID=MMETSP0738-20130409/28589_1 /TAXON_ID=385413 /ORGANISM="Thalassiosira miniscula, Strain CCMP1093" /LENGTH=201 /DNA_ID=CAMNT_0026778637 /DNA_START=128 /DNA_END=730 /DNA_ORIENTATION=-
MTDLCYWNDALNDEVQSIRQLLESFEGLPDCDKALALVQVEMKLHAAECKKRSYRMETLIVSDTKQRRGYENKLSQLTEELESCANDLQELKRGMQWKELFVGASDGNKYNEMSGEILAEDAGNMMLRNMNVIQDNTKSSIQNIKNIVAASKEVTEVTTVELSRQGEQLQIIDEEIMRVEDHLSRSEKLIKTFGKKMASIW